jgi:uncharacterized protein (DUF111 family)
MRVETLFVLETNVDDLSPQIVAYALEEMLAAGALDAWSVAATMKKGRMGSLLCALCDKDARRHAVRDSLPGTGSVAVGFTTASNLHATRSTIDDIVLPTHDSRLFFPKNSSHALFFFAFRKPRAWASACVAATAFPSTGRSWRSTSA